ncbi:hypothetical protein [Faecalibacter bovis]|uniref:Lipoprotein n=1 Tax=Faecalibacter bovis TaxID=2898187 RepID=A0ABX7XCY2_9FLAO|nr:hypothetical protein [Faecalibacter bovis]MBS7332304.1 hypothetical protein [Weeksellaceae bacterium]QTV05627.1 hypothetical protein J9309_12780 [Faecalibacter bovis]
MKNLLKLFLLSIFALFVFTACSNDDDPADNDLFVGTYNGAVSYISGDTNINSNVGNVRVVKVGNKYNFIFSNNIPNITGVEFIKEDANYSINVGGSDLSYIRINANTLKILYVVDGKTWRADATR